MYILIILLPLISSLVILLLGRNFGVRGSNHFSLLCLGIANLLSCFSYYETVILKSSIHINLFNWIPLNLFDASINFHVDSISGGMILIVNMVSFLVHLYSTSYMEGDPHSCRFMGYLSLFTFFMLVLVSSQNYVQLFIGWEGVGLCSYLLINYWFGRLQANKAAIKAMLVNRVGDAALIAGVMLIWYNYGTVNFHSIFPSNQNFASTLIPIFLLIGAVGKSAQFGLHTWLPDAMEGPTPVSALIHAATMVTAGVYLIIRSSSLFEASSIALIVTGLIGAITALFAATIGLAQNDIKKIIAYSTCSQLGFMVLACGISYYSVGLFHLINHAFFKALLFLGAGSVIHAMVDEQDIRKMGSTVLSLPLSSVFILIGSLALAGTPFMTGYYSKDLLLELSTKQYYLIIVCWLGLIATLLTAFYSFKLINRTFMLYQNSPKNWWTVAHEGKFNLLFPLFVLSMGSIFFGYFFKDPILGSVIHPNLSVLVKLTPLLLSGLGVLAGLFIFLITKNLWNLFFSFNIIKPYDFLVTAWGFDKIISTFLVGPIWKFGYKTSLKLFDLGIVETIGPFGLSKRVVLLTQNLSKLQSGYLFNYAIIMILFASIFILIN
uniref:NADH-ubiquinone oxidoreductase chain 5 n=1 Tax=Chrysaora quinquecirrha TaxID=6148 RepID=G8DM09_CHRQI|nr:NADH dehydrogenase subunit 5 [Chrysaora quinquecirrha]ADY15495.1 NADH dehydrogenase subunit 5 [Chrysaora quinquecirrha]